MNDKLTLIELLNDMRSELPCVGKVDLFFSDHPGEIAAAKSLCFQCPGRLACLELSLIRGDLNDGVFGGMSDVERRAALRRTRNYCRREGSRANATVIDALMDEQRQKQAS